MKVFVKFQETFFSMQQQTFVLESGHLIQDSGVTHRKPL